MTSTDRLMKKIGNVTVAAGALLAGTSIANSHPLAQIVESAKTSASTVSSVSANELPAPLLMNVTGGSDVQFGHQSHSSHRSHSSHSSHSSHRSHYSSSSRI
jgi:hypothetical protein